jgi:hypothetical protein
MGDFRREILRLGLRSVETGVKLAEARTCIRSHRQGRRDAEYSRHRDRSYGNPSVGYALQSRHPFARLRG